MQDIDFEIRPNKRRKHISVGVDIFGNYFIATPIKTTAGSLKNLLKSDLEKIIKKLEPQRAKIRGHFYNEGEQFLYSGKYYTLKYSDFETPLLSLQGECFYLAKKHLHKAYDLFENWYTKALRERLKTLLPFWSEKIDVQPAKINIKPVKSIWGSCSIKSNITLSVRLALVPDDLLEYVLVHELCHIKVMNHSNEFWSVVSEYIPNYKNLRNQLKKNSYLYKW